ncbi:ABC transporter permease [Paenibacillus ginsengarvi]|uniref:ABC transporter permease n=1 Tax=Paenibacillus ginsengarvi TaxID=400777 RepID=A0A3B0CX33_9BACL|nr:ABC transporter permease [Paenibacillus ginsengarvi]RKN86907.1 ABC transporter permease [Paenibacillus ginsengarvi]
MKEYTAAGSPELLTPDLFIPLDKDRQRGDKVVRESLSSWRDAWQRLRSNKLAMTGLVVLILLAVMAIFGQQMTPYNYYANDLQHTNEPPSGEHWFGTDDLGRDMFARTWMGASISLRVGLFAALIDLLVGVVYGGVMGYFGGKVDEVMNRISEVLDSIPYLLIVILFVVVFEPSMYTIILALVVTGWIKMAWIVRGQIMLLKNHEYALASRSLGAGFFRILFRHLLPNASGPIIVTLTLTVPQAIFSEAFLSFLGLGVNSPAASWGTMISDSLSSWMYLPWRLFFPAVLISLTMFAFNVFGDGLRDAFDPKMRK